MCHHQLPLYYTFNPLQASLSSAQSDFEALAALDEQIKSFNVGANPYTWFTMEALEETWRNLRKIIGNTRIAITSLFNLPLTSFKSHRTVYQNSDECLYITHVVQKCA